MQTVVSAARTGVETADVQAAVAEYRSLHDETAGCRLEDRKHNYDSMVNQYYDLVTDFYEYGWGQSFHFAPRFRGEGFKESLLRHEHFLALRMGLERDTKVLDIGCGVGGPMRNIARFTGARVTGLNNNAYQIERGDKYNRTSRLESSCGFISADFMKMPIGDGSFQAAYAIESTCHAPDRAGVFGEANRILESGGIFAGFEWCLTDCYDPSNAHHRAIKKGIEAGNALPDLLHHDEVDRALATAGFEVLESRDLAQEGDPETPWYLPLTGRDLNLAGLGRTPVGRFLTTRMLRVLERLRIVPNGSAGLHELLEKTADWLVEGGETGIFTPVHFFLAVKPRR